MEACEINVFFITNCLLTEKVKLSLRSLFLLICFHLRVSKNKLFINL